MIRRLRLELIIVCDSSFRKLTSDKECWFRLVAPHPTKNNFKRISGVVTDFQEMDLHNSVFSLYRAVLLEAVLEFVSLTTQFVQIR